MDPDTHECQSTIDVGMALHLSSPCHGLVTVSPVTSPLTVWELTEPESDKHQHHKESIFPALFPQEERELEIARGETPCSIDGPCWCMLRPENMQLVFHMVHHST